jgi:hypothetical protein
MLGALMTLVALAANRTLRLHQHLRIGPSITLLSHRTPPQFVCFCMMCVHASFF